MIICMRLTQLEHVSLDYCPRSLRYVLATTPRAKGTFSRKPTYPLSRARGSVGAEVWIYRGVYLWQSGSQLIPAVAMMTIYAIRHVCISTRYASFGNVTREQTHSTSFFLSTKTPVCPSTAEPDDKPPQLDELQLEDRLLSILEASPHFLDHLYICGEGLGR
jgi:hypothetical protein